MSFDLDTKRRRLPHQVARRVVTGCSQLAACLFHELADFGGNLVALAAQSVDLADGHATLLVERLNLADQRVQTRISPPSERCPHLRGRAAQDLQVDHGNYRRGMPGSRPR